MEIEKPMTNEPLQEHARPSNRALVVLRVATAIIICSMVLFFIFGISGVNLDKMEGLP